MKEFIDELADDDAEEVIAAMKDVALHGLRVARHLRGQIYEVRADGPDGSYRILFAEEGAEAGCSCHSLPSPRGHRRRPRGDQHRGAKA